VYKEVRDVSPHSLWQGRNTRLQEWQNLLRPALESATAPHPKSGENASFQGIGNGKVTRKDAVIIINNE